MSLPFWKLQATGNDFVFLFEQKKFLAESEKRNEFIEKACNRHFGVGADGVLFLDVEPARKVFEWRYFNRDGSETDLCGNAARAIAAWCFEVLPAVAPAEASHLQSSAKKNEISWWGGLGQFRARRRLGRSGYEVTWPLAQHRPLELPPALMEKVVELNERALTGAYLWDVGVPHLVLLGLEEWPEDQRLIFAPALRAHPSLGNAGANVTWVELKTNKTVTFERGLERETLACGSGALAAFLSLEDRAKHPLEAETLRFPGGDLVVARKGEELWLGGEARVVFKGDWNS